MRFMSSIIALLHTHQPPTLNNLLSTNLLSCPLLSPSNLFYFVRFDIIQTIKFLKHYCVSGILLCAGYTKKNRALTITTPHPHQEWVALLVLLGEF